MASRVSTKELIMPQEVKGGVFAPADIGIIKLALIQYAQRSELSREDEAKVMSLLHRLNRINGN